MKILLISWFDPCGPKAVVDHIQNIQRLSSHHIDIFNIHGKKIRLRSFFKFNLNFYDGVIFHNTASYDINTLKNINKIFSPSLDKFLGIKVLMKQDEMKRINSVRDFIQDWKINIVTTCLDQNKFPKVYGEQISKDVIPVHTLTGYVTEEMIRWNPIPLELRPLDVVYRGMETPFEWGRLGNEKLIIGQKFLENTKRFELKTDISSLNKDRIYGDKWLEFLSSSRATLAVESGASIFDFDGAIEIQCREFRRMNPQASFEEAFNLFLCKYDGIIKYNQISPRHLEATSLGTVQIMFEGEYSNIYKPYSHYIPLKKDFSNIEEVVRLLMDNNFCNDLVRKSREEILTRTELTFNYFVDKLDQAIKNC